MEEQCKKEKRMFVTCVFPKKKHKRVVKCNWDRGPGCKEEVFLRNGRLLKLVAKLRASQPVPNVPVPNGTVCLFIVYLLSA